MMSITATQLISESSTLRAQGHQDDYIFLRCQAADIPIESRNFLSHILSDGLTSEQDVEYTFPASPLQQDILALEQAQWCSVELPLPYTSFNPIDRINSSWHTLASHYSCLRSAIKTDSHDGTISIQILRRVSTLRRVDGMLANQAYIPDTEHEGTAYLELRQMPHGKPHVTLYIRRALIDSTSSSSIKLDFALVFCGLPLPRRPSERSYHRHVHHRHQYAVESERFWRAFLEGSIGWSSHLLKPPLPKSQPSPWQSATLTLNSVPAVDGMHWKSFYEVIWALILSHHTNRESILFAVSGRDETFSDAARSVGLLDQIYPVKQTIFAEDNLGRHIDRMRSSHQSASGHTSIGIERIKSVCDLDTIESMLKFSDISNSPSFEGLITDFPLLMFVNHTRPLRFTLYHRNQISSRDANCLLEHYVNAIQSSLSRLSPLDTAIGEIKLNSEVDEMNIISNAKAKSPSPSETNIAVLFEDTVRSRPHSPALQLRSGQVYSFNDINRLANRLARQAILEPKTIVPICMDRSLELVVSIFAVLKSGCAYLILDPTGAPERNNYIIRECEAEVVLTVREHTSVFEKSYYVENLGEVRADELSFEMSSNLDIDVSCHDPCYIIYTSGSTGKPKGVVLTHQAASTGIRDFSLRGNSRWLLFYNPIFSAAQRTIIATLVHGATLCIASKKDLSISLPSVINEMQIDALGITPSALATLLPSQVPNLKQITLVGEALSPTILDIWADQVNLVNTYGLSECTQLNFGQKLRPGDSPSIVGRPRDSTSSLVLVPGTTKLAPIGVPGELCLAGPQLTTGYFKQHEQTEKAFIKNPFGQGKLYRTGDSAKLLVDGRIEIISRIDLQTKINGQRVEPREVDEAIMKYRAVRDCATIAVTLGDRHVLVAGVVANLGCKWPDLVIELRKHLTKLLPLYMIPSLWYPYEKIPKTANGKTDFPNVRNEIQRVGSEYLVDLARPSRRESKQISDKKQAVMRDTWAQVLQMRSEAISLSDNFTFLGGSSLQAITAISHLRKCGFGIELSDLIGSDSLEIVSSKSQPVDQNSGEDPPAFSLLVDEDRQYFSGHKGVKDAYPATTFQEGVVAASLGGNDSYLYQRCWDVQGLDIRRLRNAFEIVFQQNDILRTTFVPRRKTFIQVVRNDLNLPWQEISQGLQQHKTDDKKMGIAAETSLLRVSILDSTILVVSTHHALFDHWSHQFLYKDVAAVYNNTPTQPRPPFSRFVKYLQGLDQADLTSFWRRYLSNSEPTRITNDIIKDSSRVEKTLPVNITEKARSLGLTTGTLVYAAWGLVLSRHTGNADVSFATTISGREISIDDIDKLDGPTLATVPQRISINQEETLRELCKTVHTGFFQMVRFSQFGMRNALASNQLKTNYIDTMVNVLIGSGGKEQAKELFSPFGPKPIWNSEYTTLEVEDDSRGLSLSISGNLPRQQAIFALESLAITLQKLLEVPDRKVRDLDIISREEREFLLTKHQPLSSDPQILYSRFEKIAMKNPNATAIDWMSLKKVTYSELDAMASEIALYLLDEGVQPRTIVPLMFDKSIEMIASILGVMKAGAAYLPLDPQNPFDRNSFIVEDVEASYVLLQRKHQQFGERLNVRTLCIEDVYLSSSDWAIVSLPIQPSVDDLAYVIYTSGSTGKPKGVKISHSSASTAVTSMMEIEGRDNGEWRTLQFANYVFDASVQDIFNTLSSGGTLCMAPTEELLSDLAGCINKMSVKQAILTPTVSRLINPDEVPTLQTLIVGGESLQADIIERWSGREIINVYGPTETSMVVAAKRIDGSSSPRNIGKPFGSVFAVILEVDSNELVPYGAVGELCIGGPQLGKGYVRRQSLNQQAFMDGHAFNCDRIYRTGDYARWLQDGELECLGRKDSQVKIHGHRIELGEIESAIQATKTVTNNAILVAEKNDRLWLTAFIECGPISGDGIQKPHFHNDIVKKLMNGLAILTAYMRPKVVIPVGRFPKIASGKINRKQLREWLDDLSTADLTRYASDGVGASHDIVPVTTYEEKVVEETWAEIFGIERTSIGASATFFSLGGDSIAAINLVSLIKKAGFKTNVSQVLAAATLRDLASKLEEIGPQDKEMTKTKFVPSKILMREVEACGLDINNDVEYTYSAPPGQVEFLNQGKRDNQLWVLMTIREFAGATNIDEWIKATTKLTQVNDILRTFWVQISQEEWNGVVLKESSIDFVIHDVSSVEERTHVIESLWNQRFFTGKPFIKYAILRHASGKRELITKMDHAVYDGTLLRIFDDHFSAIQRGHPIPPHEQFKNFADYIYHTNKNPSLAFWTNLIHNANPSYPNIASPHITASITKPLHLTLDTFSKENSITPSIIFQAAFQLTLARATSSPDVSFDYLLSGRNVDLPSPQLINGNTANFLPFRSRVATGMSVKNYLQDTQDLFWAATEHGNVGLEAIYRAAGVDRTKSGNRALFLFQPFEPAVDAEEGKERMQWVVMAKSEVRMFQSYGLVVEVARIVGGYRVKVMFDESGFGKLDAERIADVMVGLVGRIVGDVGVEAVSLLL